MDWISVEDVTPSRHEDVLVFDSNEDVYMAHYTLMMGSILLMIAQME